MTEHKNVSEDELKEVLGEDFISISLRPSTLKHRLQRLSAVLARMNGEESETKRSELEQHLVPSLFSKELMHHKSGELGLVLACCYADLCRIYAPSSPTDNETMIIEMFSLMWEQLEGLKQTNKGKQEQEDDMDNNYPLAFRILESLSAYLSFVLLFNCKKGFQL
ncbi:hypothetical protein RFI_15935, partial [Reticulomyxa filosa]